MSDESFLADGRFAAGVREFNAGRFFEAHEVWEEQWNELVGDEKVFVQGLIQIAAGYLKYELGNQRAAMTLWDKGRGRINASGIESPRLGLDVLLADVDEALTRLRQGQAVVKPLLQFN